jgi:hypothetical protein
MHSLMGLEQGSFGPLGDSSGVRGAGGIVVWGSNSSTAKEAAKELAAAESERAALIAHINPRVIS